MVGILLEGEKYEPATNLFQRGGCVHTDRAAHTEKDRERVGRSGRDGSRGGARPACSHPLFAVLFKKLAARYERCPTPRDSRLFYLVALLSRVAGTIRPGWLSFFLLLFIMVIYGTTKRSIFGNLCNCQSRSLSCGNLSLVERLCRGGIEEKV